MKLPLPYTLLLALLGYSHVILALITLDTIRNLTLTTDECRERILESGKVDLGDGAVAVDGIARALGGIAAQEILGVGRHGKDGDEIEDTVTASLRLLYSSLLVELEKPLSSSPSSSSLSYKECKVVKNEYHAFLAATVKFLHEVQLRQEVWRWGASSPVFEAVGWGQSLWAGRGGNNQNRSFIEQQMSLYAGTGCFGKSQEVLRRGVEVVEYMNDLIDSFN